ncbi:MAG: T9SS type A sorting domain-containing protein, partial [Bacteroidia bacterium]|nr:T9SS type A sorting domain-containing protein [Bacteroidia bacterium]
SAGTLPSGYSNLANRSAIALKESSTTYTKKTITFASNIWQNTLLCIEDVDAQEDVKITFKDASGNIINPNSTNITQSLPTSNPPASTTTSTHINLVHNLSNIGSNNLADPVVMLKMNLSTVRSIEIETRNSPGSNLGFYFAHPTPNLPVDLIHFDIHATANLTAQLNWVTASEINNSHFEIERSYDGITFEIVGEVAGNGNSQHQIEYSYLDEGISLMENTVFYRLKQVDFDGASEYSHIRVVRFDELGSGIHLSAYPNPTTDELIVMVSLNDCLPYQIEITNLQGAKVHQENHANLNGIHKLNTSEWKSGMYILKVASDQDTQHIKVMKK